MLLAVLAGAVLGCGGSTPKKGVRDAQFLDIGRPRAAGTVRPEVLLVGPDLAAWMPDLPPPPPRQAGEELKAQSSPAYPMFAMAAEHDALVYQATNLKYGRGVLRYGQHTPVRPRGKRAHCRGGQWYELMLGGYLCSSRGFEVVEEPPPLPEDATPPAVGRPLPYDYAKAEDGSLRFSRPPTRTELARSAELEDPTALDVVIDKLDGVYIFAMSGEEAESDGVSYARTVQGHYVVSDALEPKLVPQMHGEPVTRAQPLPLAFVYGDEPAPLAWLEGVHRFPAGHAQKHARLSVVKQVFHDGEPFWVANDGLAIPADRVRVAKAIEPPPGVDKDERWVHVNLPEQTLVAYRGPQPVYATLVSSGKEGYDTPAGEFRVLHKYISTTMKGDDPVDGYYYIEEVPWTQYYSGSFALHGAFWHSDFGRVRSHGCTNLAPVDARWLYHFTNPRVPERWHGVRKQGTRVLITD